MRIAHISKSDFIVIFVAIAICFGEDIYGFIQSKINVHPITQEICAVIVSKSEEKPKLSKEQILALQSLDVVKYMESKNYPFIKFDPDTKVSEGKEYPDILLVATIDSKDKPSPYLIIYDRKGEILQEGTFANESELKSSLTKWGGL
jgi:hypothetical protein